MLRIPPFKTTPTRSLRRGVAVLAITPLLFAACGGSDNGGEQGADAKAPKATANEVVMELVAFKPETLEVARGTTVTWRQKDAGAHTVTSGTVQQGGAGVTQQPDGKFDSKDIATGGTFEFTFAEGGTYPYFCALHPATMRGEIRVT